MRSALLRLDPQRRAAFDEVLDLQKAPRLDQLSAPRGEDALLALSGLVYAAWFQPGDLLISDDPLLLRKHQFVDPRPLARLDALFPVSQLNPGSLGPASHIRGGFAGFAEVADKLAQVGALRDKPSTNAPADPAPPQANAGRQPKKRPAPAAAASAMAAGSVFRVDGRLVEVFVTVRDGKGRHIDGLQRKQFTVREDAKPQNITVFEPQTSDVSCALLLDTTGSMLRALPSLKNAAFKLISELRAGDSVAVFSFNNAVTELQPFTTDKTAAKRALMRAYAAGETALFDAITRVSRELASRSGRKIIVVFTDGGDNASALPADAAIERAKVVGAPLYSVAEGAALSHAVLLKQLEAVSKATGGESFAVRGSGQIRQVFAGVADDVKHNYLLGYQPAPSESHAWRTIEVKVNGSKDYKVRAREGYYP